jgi:hypothetical protein
MKIKLLLLCGMISTVPSLTFAENIQAVKQSPLSVKAAISNKNQLILASGAFDPAIQQLDFSNTGVTSVDSQKYGIVQFLDKKSDFNWLKVNGFSVIQNLTHNAYVVNWQNSDKNILQGNTDIRWFGAFQSGYKTSPNLWIANREVKAMYQISVHTFKDVKNFNLNGLIQKYFSHVKILKSNIPQGFNQYTIEVASNHLDEVISLLSANEDIQWLNNYNPQEFFNNEAVSATQASSGPGVTPIYDQGIFGSGQIVGVADSGLDRNEDWFVHHDNGTGIVTAITDAEDVTPPTLGSMSPNNKVIAYWIMPGAEAYDNGGSFHGTHVTGSVAGDRQQAIGGGPGGSVSNPNSNGYDNDDGMAPNAQIIFSDIGSDTGLSGIGSTPMWQQAFAAGAAIHTNSYGAPSGGDYSGSSQRADDTLRELEDMIILFASGNSGPGADTIGTPATAKNVTTVGYLGHGNSTTLNISSSRGPTDDGRLKPDMAATGTSIQSAAGDTNNANSIEAPQIRSLSGSSMATPITAGSTALLRQYFTDGFHPTGSKNTEDKHTPSGPLMKAMLLNGTNTDGGFFTNDIGWGRVWLENSLYFNGEAKRFRFWEKTNTDGLKTGEQFTVDIAIQAGEEFRATLVWYDLPGPTGSGITLVNNLNLTVQQGGNTYLANNFSANNSVGGGSSDAINTVEQVRFSAPVSGTYTITVDAANIPGNGVFNSEKQGFALVVSGDLSSGNTPAPSSGPSALTAVANGLTGIGLDWTSATGDYDNYEVYRMIGSCAAANLTQLRYIGSSITNSFSDSNTEGGYQYSYKVRAYSDDLISEYTNCIDVVSDQICSIPPTFAQSSVNISSNLNDLCQVDIAWNAASNNCPETDNTQYNIYRSTSHNFIPGPASLITTTGLNTVNYKDTTVISGQPYYYIVKAEDATTDGTGPNSGNETIEGIEVVATALSTTTVEGSIIDGIDNLSIMSLSSIWSISNEQSSNGSLSYRSAIEGSNTYPANTCASMYSSTFSIPASPASPPSISYQARYNVEVDWDGVVVEISTNGGASWVDLPPNGGYPNDFSSTQGNSCNYAPSQGAFNGNSSGVFQQFTHDLTAFQGQTVQIRWNLSTDGGAEEEGFYLDQLNYNNILAPQACTLFSDEVIFANSFE